MPRASRTVLRNMPLKRSPLVLVPVWNIYMTLPGGPVAYNYFLLSYNYGLLWDIVAHYVGLLGVPGMCICI